MAFLRSSEPRLAFRGKPRRVEHPRLQRVEDYGPLGYGHHFRLEHPADIDDELQKLMEEAYRVGTQELTRRKTWIN